MNRIQLNYLLWVACLLAAVTVSCARAPGQTAALAPSPLQSQGGMDSGGGNVEATPLPTVEKLLDVYPEIFSRILYRVELGWKQTSKKIESLGIEKLPKDDPAQPKLSPSERRFLKNVSAVFHSFFTRDNIHKKTLAELIADGTWHLDTTRPCLDHGKEERDGSGNISGLVCLDPKRLARLPGRSLVRELFPLLVHESAHVMNFGEIEAVDIQAMVTLVMGTGEIMPEMNDVGNWYFVHTGLTSTYSKVLNLSEEYKVHPTDTLRSELCKNILLGAARLQENRDRGFEILLSNKDRDDLHQAGISAYNFCAKEGENPFLFGPFTDAPAWNNVDTLQTRVALISKILNDVDLDLRGFISGESVPDVKANFGQPIAFDAWIYLMEKGIEVQSIPADHNH